MQSGGEPHHRQLAPHVRGALDAWSDVPAFLVDRHLNVVASNVLARAVSPSFDEGVNLAVYTFIDSAEAQCNTSGWVTSAQQVTALLRESLDEHEPDDSYYRIVGELSTKSSAFADEWAVETKSSSSGWVWFPHEVVGPMTLKYVNRRIGNAGLLFVWHPCDEQSRAALSQLADTVTGSRVSGN